jgi:hypothetical protein
MCALDHLGHRAVWSRSYTGGGSTNVGELSPNLDITPILRGWRYVPDEIVARKVVGLDGKPKIQMRMPMGVIQMEAEGRPDGVRPEGSESYLDLYEVRCREMPDGFLLDPDDCAKLREEATLYYHRYLSLFHLSEYEGVISDTARNLRCLDLVKRYADDTGDKMALEQYRPYILMMNARASGYLYLERKLRGKALGAVRKGIAGIEKFLRDVGREELIGYSPELTILRQFEGEIKEHVPEAKLEDLREEMHKAVASENYERAAQVRDEIRRIQGLA